MEAVGCRGCIGRGIGDLVGVHTCLVLAEAQFTQRQQRQVRRGRFLHVHPEKLLDPVDAQLDGNGRRRRRNGHGHR